MSIQKAISGNDYKQGRVVTYASNAGAFSTLSPQIMPSAITPDPFIYGNGSPVTVNRDAALIQFIFASGSSTSLCNGLTYVDISPFAFGGFYAPSEFTGDTITFRSKNPIDPSGSIKLTKTAASGWNYFDADELVQISSSMELSVSTSVAVSNTSSIYLELKS
jgi:hypothetical protein